MPPNHQVKFSTKMDYSEETFNATFPNKNVLKIEHNARSVIAAGLQLFFTDLNWNSV